MSQSERNSTIVISEIFPNPKGKDSNGEWVEIYNGSASRVDISGWRLVTSPKTSAILSGSIGPGEYKIFSRPTTKISLRNSDGFALLYDSAGHLVSRLAFMGAAPEGKSYANTSVPHGFSPPTPGGPSLPLQSARSSTKEYSDRVIVRTGGETFFAAGAAIFCALIAAVCITTLFSRNDDISQLFFRGDE